MSAWARVQIISRIQVALVHGLRKVDGNIQISENTLAKQYVVHYGLLAFASRPAATPYLTWALVKVGTATSTGSGQATLLQHGLWAARPAVAPYH